MTISDYYNSITSHSILNWTIHIVTAIGCEKHQLIQGKGSRIEHLDVGALENGLSYRVKVRLALLALYLYIQLYYMFI